MTKQGRDATFLLEIEMKPNTWKLEIEPFVSGLFGLEAIDTIMFPTQELVI